MKTLHSVVSITVAVGAAACALTIAGSYYTMDARLVDRKLVRHAVNQPMRLPSPLPESLTMQKRNKAEVLATQPLWVQTGPRLPHLTIYTMPDVQCPALPRSGDQVTSVR